MHTGPRARAARAAAPGDRDFWRRLCSAGPKCWSGFTPGAEGHVHGCSAARTGPSGHPPCLLPLCSNHFFTIPSGKQTKRFTACYKLLSRQQLSGDLFPACRAAFMSCCQMSAAQGSGVGAELFPAQLSRAATPPPASRCPDRSPPEKPVLPHGLHPSVLSLN